MGKVNGTIYSTSYTVAAMIIILDKLLICIWKIKPHQTLGVVIESIIVTKEYM